MAETARARLPLVAPEQALKHVTHNEALLLLDALVHLAVESDGETAPPAMPGEGTCYAIGPGASDSWAGHDGEIGIWSAGGWRFATPGEGWVMWDKQAGNAKVFVSGAWADFAAHLGAVQNLRMLGVNATADSISRFAVRSEAVLLSAIDVGAGGSGDLRLTLNKEGSADHVLLALQTGYSGRAEIGLAGTDDLCVKVSADGDSFATAMTIAAESGFVTLNRLFGAEPSFPAIAAGVLTVTTSYAVPLPESGSADTIDTINGGEDGSLLILSGTAGNVLTLSDGTGNLKLSGNRVLDNFDDTLMLIRRGGDWLELSFSDNG